MSAREFMVVIHRPDMRSRTSERDVIAIGIQTAGRSADIFAPVSRSHPLYFASGTRIGIIRDDHFPWLHVLRAQRSQRSLETGGTISRHQRHTQTNFLHNIPALFDRLVAYHQAQRIVMRPLALPPDGFPFA